MEKEMVISTLSGGIGYEMFFYALVGTVIHLMYKWIHSMDESKRKGESFYFANWLISAAPTFMFSALCGLVGVFGLSQYWPPLTITKAVVSGLLSGSAIFNLLPAASNPQLWRSIGKWLVSKFKPK